MFEPFVQVQEFHFDLPDKVKHTKKGLATAVVITELFSTSQRFRGSEGYLLVLLRKSPPLRQEKVARGEACGRHSMMASPPCWTSVDFFTGFLEKSGGEAAK